MRSSMLCLSFLIWGYLAYPRQDRSEERLNSLWCLPHRGRVVNVVLIITAMITEPPSFLGPTRTPRCCFGRTMEASCPTLDCD